ncbi:MAG: hypothetical protein K8R48_02835 [Alphaproteobacteria bacterium]|nr:hypothetical protein [Alphaproteobacteria bacterium]
MENNPNDKRDLSAQDFFSALSKNDLKDLGVGNVAYIRRHIIDGQATFVLYAADGEQLMAQNSENILQQDACHQDLNLVTVH